MANFAQPLTPEMLYIPEPCELEDLAADLAGFPSAREEAGALLSMVERGALGKQEALDLIGVTPKIAGVLREFARRNPRDGAQFERILQWRGEVLAEFARLSAESASRTA